MISLRERQATCEAVSQKGEQRRCYVPLPPRPALCALATLTFCVLSGDRFGTPLRRPCASARDAPDVVRELIAGHEAIFHATSTADYLRQLSQATRCAVMRV